MKLTAEKLHVFIISMFNVRKINKLFVWILLKKGLTLNALGKGMEQQHRTELPGQDGTYLNTPK